MMYISSPGKGEFRVAAQIPFEVNIVASVSGKTISIAPAAANTSGPGTLDSTNTYAPHVLVTNPNAFTVFVRMSPEATPVATAADVPIAATSVRLFANAEPNSKLGIAVLASVTTAVVYFVPGQGGII